MKPTKRIINIKAEFDLTDPELVGMKLTDKKIVEEMVKKDMLEIFEYDEGFEKVTVTCDDY